MVDCRFKSADLMKKLVDGMRELNKELNIEATPEGLEISCMDSSQVSLITCSVKLPAFEEYSCERKTLLGVSLEMMAKILKLCQSTDRLRLQAQPNSGTLMFTADNPADDRTSAFELRLLKIDDERLGVPPQEYSSVVRMSSKHFADCIRDLSVFGDSLMVQVGKESVQFGVDGEQGTGAITLKPRGGDGMSEGAAADGDVRIVCKEPVSAVFSMRFMQTFAKASPLAREVTFKLHPEMPIVVEFPLETYDNGFLCFYLAPKMDEQ